MQGLFRQVSLSKNRRFSYIFIFFIFFMFFLISIPNSNALTWTRGNAFCKLTGCTVTGNITSENVFIPQYIFPHTNETIILTGAGAWSNITFGQEETDLKFGIEHSTGLTNDTFTINQTGIYDISFNLDVIDTSASASTIDIAARMVYINETEIRGSVFETDIIKQQVETEISHEFLARLNAGDAVKFQFTATDTDVEISSHGTFGEHPESVSIVMKKIANLP